MVVTVALACFAAAAACALVRLVIGPTLADRVAALDVALISLMCAIATGAAARRSVVELDLLVVIAAVAFTATIAASRFIEHERGDRSDREATR
ncbi:MAG: monovalent cation/H+ antiporter complex subunit F [Acidimicrobiia bacterium]|nr:monovalent cation/H+ antiporter complex subunit F [Acidimicrobiia bacterium]